MKDRMWVLTFQHICHLPMKLIVLNESHKIYDIAVLRVCGQPIKITDSYEIFVM